MSTEALCLRRHYVYGGTGRSARAACSSWSIHLARLWALYHWTLCHWTLYQACVITPIDASTRITTPATTR